MMRLVIDASVAVSWVVPEPEAEAALMIRDAFAAGDLDIVAPDLFVAEVSNALWKKCRLRRELTVDEARRALTLLWRALPDLVPVAALSAQALDLAMTYRRPVYDCIYVALALREQCPLITADEPLRTALRPTLATVLQSPAEAAAALAARIGTRSARKDRGQSGGGSHPAEPRP